MGSLSVRLRLALIAVATAALLPLVVCAMTADSGPSGADGIASALVMVVAFLVGMVASIGAIARNERLGWATLAATITVPLVWFFILAALVAKF